MARLIVSNNDNENMTADRRMLTYEYRRASAVTAKRIAWFAQPGDIVLIPRDLSPTMKRYIAQWKGYEPETVRIVTPDWEDSEVRPLGTRELTEPRLVELLRTAMGTCGGWELMPYYYDRSVVRLSAELGLGGGARANRFLCHGGAEFLNDKRAFRALAAGRGISLAPGEVCMGAEELERAFAALIGITSAVIIKQDRHSGAEGNLVVSGAEGVSGQGAVEVLIANDTLGLRTAARNVWKRLAYQEHAALVVEAYYSVQAVLYAEFGIDPGSGSTALLNWGEQRMEPIFKGFVIPPSLPAHQGARFLHGATELARLTCDLGFQGLMDVDGIVTTSGEVIFNEINARSGGCSHIHHIADQLIGPDYQERAVIAAYNKIKSPGIDEVIGILSQEGLHFDRGRRRGIIITAEDEGMGVLEFLAIAPERPAALQLEKEFEKLLQVSLRAAA